MLWSIHSTNTPPRWYHYLLQQHSFIEPAYPTSGSLIKGVGQGLCSRVWSSLMMQPRNHSGIFYFFTSLTTHSCYQNNGVAHLCVTPQSIILSLLTSSRSILCFWLVFAWKIVNQQPSKAYLYWIFLCSNCCPKQLTKIPPYYPYNPPSRTSPQISARTCMPTICW